MEEYIHFELSSSSKHEYVSRMIDAMAGTTRRHNTIARKIDRLGAAAIEDRDCRAFIRDVRL